MNKTKILFILAPIIFLLVWLYRSWFSGGLIAAGDFWPLYPSQYGDYTFILNAWNNQLNNGFGGDYIFLSWNQPFFNLPIALWAGTFHLAYSWVERLSYFFPYLVLSSIGPWYAARKLYGNSIWPIILAFIIFSCNTYILLVTGGGQLTIAFAYAMSCIIWGLVLTTPVQHIHYKRSLGIGILIGIQVFFDLRITYITLVGILIYFLYQLYLLRLSASKKDKVFLYMRSLVLYILVIPLFVAVSLNLFWILPALRYPQPPSVLSDTAYTSVSAVKYFSFATLENSISLLHPYWPENIFGKVLFMNPLFLVIPVLSFLSLYFLKKNKNISPNQHTIIFLNILAMVGIFLAKGVNQPFGTIYTWLFFHLPGFVLFRDPTKWYVMTAFAYALLIPFTCLQIIGIWQKKKMIRHYSQPIVFIMVLGFFLYTIFPALTGQLTGTYHTVAVPRDYLQLERYLASQPNFFRTLWIPSLQRLGYYSQVHPGVSASLLFDETDISELLTDLQSSRAQQRILSGSIKYIIIPYDTAGEFFQSDRKYDKSKYLSAISTLRRIHWLREVQGFGRNKVFTVMQEQQPLFWSTDSQATIKAKEKTRTEYILQIHSSKNSNVIFSQQFDPQWILTSDHRVIHPEKDKNGYMQFVLPGGARTYALYYQPQMTMNLGTGISVVCFVVYLTLLAIHKRNVTIKK